jgi:hypothetical protein
VHADALRHLTMQVHIDTFADGPTRVVRFSDEVATPFDTSTAELIRQTHFLQERLHATDRRFAALRGASGIGCLNVFGQTEQRLARLPAERRATCDAAVLPRQPSVSTPPSAATSGPPLRVQNEVRPWQQHLGLLDPSEPGSTKTAAAVSLMLAGDLKVTVLEVRGHVMEGAANTMVRLVVEQQMQQSGVQWGARKPVWDEAFSFYAVCPLWAPPFFSVVLASHCLH